MDNILYVLHLFPAVKNSIWK